jgi:NodT family efflux transporter outer membrane factor (OMF) lipoprotein
MSPMNNPRRFAALAASISLAALASGCAAVGPNFERPAVPTASGYQSPGEAAPAMVRLDPAVRSSGPWWNAFGSAQLDAVIRQAIAGSPTLAEADATLAQSQSALAEARGVAGPQADLTAGVDRQRANLQAFGFSSFGGVSLANPTFTLYSLGGSVGYDLDLFGGQRRRIESATARAQAQQQRAEAAYLTLTSNVALQVVTIATLNAQIDAVGEMIKADEANIDLVHKAGRLGGSTAGARVSAEAQLEEDRALLPPLRRQLDAAKHALAMLVGKAPADWAAPDFTLADLNLSQAVPVTLPSALVRKRPDILAAEADLHAATADVGVATADLYPNIRIGASLTQGSLKPGDIFGYDASAWDLGVGLTAPIFNGGALKARRQQAREAARASMARYQQTVLGAFVQVADALSALAQDDEAIASYDRAQAQANERVRLARAAYDLGGGTLLEVLDAQRQSHNIQAARVRAQGQRLIDVVRLFAASGADWRVEVAA